MSVSMVDQLEDAEGEGFVFRAEPLLSFVGDEYDKLKDFTIPLYNSYTAWLYSASRSRDRGYRLLSDGEVGVYKYFSECHEEARKLSTKAVHYVPETKAEVGIIEAIDRNILSPLGEIIKKGSERKVILPEEWTDITICLGKEFLYMYSRIGRARLRYEMLQRETDPSKLIERYVGNADRFIRTWESSFPCNTSALQAVEFMIMDSYSPEETQILPNIVDLKTNVEVKLPTTAKQSPVATRVNFSPLYEHVQQRQRFKQEKILCPARMLKLMSNDDKERLEKYTHRLKEVTQRVLRGAFPNRKERQAMVRK